MALSATFCVGARFRGRRRGIAAFLAPAIAAETGAAPRPAKGLCAETPRRTALHQHYMPSVCDACFETSHVAPREPIGDVRGARSDGAARNRSAMGRDSWAARGAQVQRSCCVGSRLGLLYSLGGGGEGLGQLCIHGRRISTHRQRSCRCARAPRCAPPLLFATRRSLQPPQKQTSLESVLVGFLVQVDQLTSTQRLLGAQLKKERNSHKQQQQRAAKPSSRTQPPWTARRPCTWPSWPSR